MAAVQAAGYSGRVLTAGEDDDFQVVELWEAVTAASVLTPREVYAALAGGQQPRARERQRGLGFRAVLADSHVCQANNDIGAVSHAMSPPTFRTSFPLYLSNLFAFLPAQLVGSVRTQVGRGHAGSSISFHTQAALRPA